MNKKTKHIIISVLSFIIWLVLFFIPLSSGLLVTIRFLIQVSLIWFGLNSLKNLQKISAAKKLLKIIENNIDFKLFEGICMLVYFSDDIDVDKYLNYVKLLTPNKKQRLKFGNYPANSNYWFKPYDWDTRIKYLKSYL